MTRPTCGALARAVLALMLCGAAPLAAQDEPAPASGLPERVETAHELVVDGEPLPYTAVAGTLPVGEGPDGPGADLFYVAYLADGTDDSSDRPVTFLVNGGPGAASVFLHLGTAGPRRLALAEDGTPDGVPVPLEDNPLTWLAFTDLVFVDPVGTGYSRVRPRSPEAGEDGQDRGRRGDGGNEFWSLDRDLETLADFMRLWLGRYERWQSPVVLAGESYGGFRAAALAGRLEDEAGIPLAGVILVSPALEFAFLRGAERWNVLPWAVLVPSYAAVAAHHGRSDTADDPATLAAAEAFTLEELVPGLAAAEAPDGLYERLATVIGLPPERVARLDGRVPVGVFAKELLADEERLVGRYDGLVTGRDPRPGSPSYRGPDPSFDFLVGAYGPALLGYLRGDLNYPVDARYEILNREVGRRWRYGDEGDQGFPGAAEDLRGALLIDHGPRVMVAHGRHDLVTPYFASAYLLAQMDLPAEVAARVLFAAYTGGHMFYLRDDSQAAFVADLRDFYAGLAD
jgi:carboxypeptidase C (cathepsin A)